jgi:hypothetical protein
MPDSDDKEVWIVVDPRCSLPLGTPVILSDSAVALRGHALTELESEAQPVHVQKVRPSDVADIIASLQDIGRPVLERQPLGDGGTGSLTPRAQGTEGADTRIMPTRVLLPYEPAGLGRSGPKEVLEKLKSSKPSLWPLQGPMSLLWVLEFCIAQTGALLNARVSQFMQLTRMSFTDAHMTEYSVIAKSIEFGLYTDQLMITQLASFELLARRFQLIEEKFKFRLPSFDSNKGSLDPENDASLFLGLGTSSMAGRTAVCVMPALAEYIGEELGREAAISKGKVKAHEMRQQLRKLGGAGGGGKKAAGGGHDDQ